MTESTPSPTHLEELTAISLACKREGILPNENSPTTLNQVLRLASRLNQAETRATQFEAQFDEARRALYAFSREMLQLQQQVKASQDEDDSTSTPIEASIKEHMRDTQAITAREILKVDSLLREAYTPVSAEQSSTIEHSGASGSMSELPTPPQHPSQPDRVAANTAQAAPKLSGAELLSPAPSL